MEKSYQKEIYLSPQLEELEVYPEGILASSTQDLVDDDVQIPW